MEKIKPMLHRFTTVHFGRVTYEADFRATIEQADCVLDESRSDGHERQHLMPARGGSPSATAWVIDSPSFLSCSSSACGMSDEHPDCPVAGAHALRRSRQALDGRSPPDRPGAAPPLRRHRRCLPSDSPCCAPRRRRWSARPSRPGGLPRPMERTPEPLRAVPDGSDEPVGLRSHRLSRRPRGSRLVHPERAAPLDPHHMARRRRPLRAHLGSRHPSPLGRNPAACSMPRRRTEPSRCSTSISTRPRP